MARTTKLSIEITVAEIGRAHMAVTRLGGIQVRGPRADSPEYAVRGLFHRLSGEGTRDDDAMVAIDLAVAGESLDTLELEAPTPPASS